MAQQELETLFQFPCAFPIKIMGDKDTDLLNAVKKAFADENIDLKGSEINTRDSSNGKYLSITVIFTAQSKEQLDSLYQRLTKLSDVKMVL